MAVNRTVYVKKGSRYVDIGDGDMIAFAFRYALGRMSTAPSTCADWLVAHWHLVPARTRAIIIRDLEEAFDRDDRFKAHEKNTIELKNWRPLGHDCDRAQWARVRALYRTPTCWKCGTECKDDVPHTLHTDGERSCRDCVPFECERCGKSIKGLENIITDPVTRRSRHVMKCGETA